MSKKEFEKMVVKELKSQLKFAEGKDPTVVITAMLEAIEALTENDPALLPFAIEKTESLLDKLKKRQSIKVYEDKKTDTVHVFGPGVRAPEKKTKR